MIIQANLKISEKIVTAQWFLSKIKMMNQSNKTIPIFMNLKVLKMRVQVF